MLSLRTSALLLGSAALTVEAARDIMPTPPMGFNNWARFMCDLDEKLFTETADAMVSTGLLDAGYNWVNVDDCWPLHERDEDDRLQWDPELFPNGMIWLGKYIKERGLKFGIYSDAGTLTCGEYPGSLGYEEIDAQTFAEWGVEYLKLDGCNVPVPDGDTMEKAYKDIYEHWHEVLSKMDNPLVFSESAPAYFSSDENLTDWYTVMDWIPGYGELARHSADIATYNTSKPWESLMYNYDEQLLVTRYQKPGYFNDPDFIIADEPLLTLEEKRSQFALWCSGSAPLMISAYIPDLTEDELDYLTNADLIEVDQDPLGLPATLVSRDNTWDVLTKDLANGDRLLTVLNRGDGPASTTISFASAGLSSDNSCAYQLRDLWTGENSTASGEVTISDLPSHFSVVYRISSNSDDCGLSTPTGLIFNTASKNCLGASGETVTWSECDGEDSQTWRVDGSQVLALGEDELCLTDGGVDGVTLGECDESDDQSWSFTTTGNIISAGSQACLTERTNATVATTSTCQHNTNSQVIAVPVGVEFE